MDERRDETIILLLACLVALGIGWRYREAIHARIVEWIHHTGLLDDTPLVAIPGLGGLGLDLARLVVAAGLLLAAAAATWTLRGRGGVNLPFRKRQS